MNLGRLSCGLFREERARLLRLRHFSGGTLGLGEGESRYANFSFSVWKDENYRLDFAIGAPPNNGMHPTADTLLVKFLQRLVAAGDAGR